MNVLLGLEHPRIFQHRLNSVYAHVVIPQNGGDEVGVPRNVLILSTEDSTSCYH